MNPKLVIKYLNSDPFETGRWINNKYYIYSECDDAFVFNDRTMENRKKVEKLGRVKMNKNTEPE